MAKKKLEWLLARKSTDELVRLPSDEHPEYDMILKHIEEAYPRTEHPDMVGALFPEGYKIAAVLLFDDQKDSKNDKWEFIIYDVTKDLGIEAGTITLDNLDAFNETETMEDKLEIIKSISGHYEEIIKESVSIIRQYKGNGTS